MELTAPYRSVVDPLVIETGMDLPAHVRRAKQTESYKSVIR